jgi:hypothetical protein
MYGNSPARSETFGLVLARTAKIHSKEDSDQGADVARRA